VAAAYGSNHRRLQELKAQTGGGHRGVERRVKKPKRIASPDKKIITGGLEEFSERALDILPQCPSG
jgi:hypothetical protein